jgi:hypothetical protein
MRGTGNMCRQLQLCGQSPVNGRTQLMANSLSAGRDNLVLWAISGGVFGKLVSLSVLVFSTGC